MNKNLSIKIEYRYVVAAIYAVVLFLDRLDLTIVNIALPALAEYFNVPITQTEWVNNAYLLALAMSIPISGWGGDRFGVKKVFIIATCIFGLSSLLCAFSPNLITMAILRFLQGLGGGVIVPVGMTMVYRIFDNSEYASITSFIFIPTLIAPAIAPALGGVMINYFGWAWVFLFAVPICFIVIVLSIIILKEQKNEEKTPLDWLGFLLSSCSLILMLYFISSLGKHESYFQITAILIATIFSSYLFQRREKNSKFPLIDIKFFKNELFRQANLIQLAFQICHYGAIFLIAMYLQVGVGMSAMDAGLIMGMQAIGAICTSRYSVKLFHQFGPGLPIIIGFIGIAVITPCILLINAPKIILIGSAILFIRGFFIGLCGTPIQTASIIGFKKEDIGRASALFNAGRQVSISFGIALTALLITYGFELNGLDVLQPVSQPGKSIFYYAFILITVVSFLGILIATKMNNKKIIALISQHKIE
jgi:EmrB/QacA subfamily drug resistance transporter